MLTFLTVSLQLQLTDMLFLAFRHLQYQQLNNFILIETKFEHP